MLEKPATVSELLTLAESKANSAHQFWQLDEGFSSVKCINNAIRDLQNAKEAILRGEKP